MAEIAKVKELRANISCKAPTMDQAISQVGTGAAQWKLLIMCGLTFCSDAAEVTFLSYVTEVLRCEWGITSRQETYLTSAVFGGMILGAPVWGCIADRVGRRPSFLASSVVICTFGFITAACQNLTQLMLCRALVGFGVAGLPVGFDILAEALPGERRGPFLLYIEYFWTLGSIYVNCIAWGTLETAGWRVFTALAAIPTLLASVAGYLALPESPRWLLAEGHASEALDIIRKWARDNGKALEFTALRHEKEADESSHQLSELCKRRKLLKPFLLMIIVWTSFGIAYYGIVMLLPRIFGSHSKVGACHVAFDFIDLAIASVSEVIGVAIAIAIIDNPGRAWCQGIFYALGAASALMLGFRSLGKTVLTFVASVGRLSEMAASCATWVHTPELFPTHVRAEVHGMLNLASKVGAVLAPFLISDMFTQMQCGFIMGGISLTAAVAALCLPETARIELADVSDCSSTTASSSDEEEVSED